MYFFLAISLQKDVVKGTFWPSYVLCRAYTTSAKRSGYRIIKIFDGVQQRNIPRLLFTEIYGHEDLINFMSSYQCQDENGKHYHPRGYLCWYECNKYGEPTGKVIPIKKVPEYIWIYAFSERGFQRLKKERKKKMKLKEILSKEPRASPLETDKKIKLAQTKPKKKKGD